MSDARLTPLGRLLSILLVGGLIALGVYIIGGRRDTGPAPATAPDAGGEAEVSEARVEVPRLGPPGVYQFKDETIDVEISEYAGYAGLIVANGGLQPNENSVFFKDHGFKVRLSLSEDEDWSEFNAGALAASVTTVDVLAAYGKQFHGVVPAQIGFSRGADGLVVLDDIKRINDLRGRIVATAQFTEVDFFIRYLAQEAGLEVAALDSLEVPPHPDKVNLVFTEDGFAAGDLFARELQSGRGRLAGCVTWEPKTSEVVDQSGGRARVLTTNKNLLIVADILVVHRTFAEQHPDKVAGLVHGLLEGNRRVRENPEANLDTIARAFGWSREDTRDELTKVHLSNLPENLAFFTGTIDSAGSFGGIFQSAVLAYGSVIKDPVDSDRFADLTYLRALEQKGTFKDQQIAIAPIRSTATAAVETDPLLSKDIRFYFEPNSADLDMQNAENLQNLEAIRKLLQVSPGSTIVLRGHVDNARVDEFRRSGGEALVRKYALEAMELSKRRAAEVKRWLVERQKVNATRLDTVGRGWEEPVSTNSELNRRVEVQWFTLE
jgi:NitT/TauT family transport system substrate-binding protein